MVDIVNKEIIFEGIETEEQEQMLLNCGFSHGQGYLCNRPIPAEDFEELYLTS
jgi:EAL domain-containing protein (putative c-di-GMP-specific phosphodiesterase class I)